MEGGISAEKAAREARMSLSLNERAVSVHKQQVERFHVSIGTGLGDLQHVDMSRDDAIALWNQLGEQLGIRFWRETGCGSRFSHPPHLHNVGVCVGRSTDAT